MLLYCIEITRKDLLTGEVRTWRDRKRYRTLAGAQRAAISWNSVTKPDGRTATTETSGRVVLT